MNVKIGTEAAQFPEKEYINGIFLAVNHITFRPILSDATVPLKNIWQHFEFIAVFSLC
jgi:hypothetical protein